MRSDFLKWLKKDVGGSGGGYYDVLEAFSFYLFLFLFLSLSLSLSFFSVLSFSFDQRK